VHPAASLIGNLDQSFLITIHHTILYDRNKDTIAFIYDYPSHESQQKFSENRDSNIFEFISF